MSEVDFHDEMLTYYPCQCKTIGLYKKLNLLFSLIIKIEFN